jgi:REP element-mobilizing transposase RayT
MATDLRVEDPDGIYFLTIRTANSRLWFVNNKKFEERILTFLARYQEMHEVTLYGFIIMGNHYHLIARFPKANRASFMKDFNARFSLALQLSSDRFEGGRLWARRYKPLCLPNDKDVENWFFYCVLNPVYSGLVERIGDYDSYNSFVDSASGRVRKFKYIDWTSYRDKKRFNKDLTPDDFSTIHELKYTRLPGQEDLSEREYKKYMFQKLEEFRLKAIKARRDNEQGFAGKEILRKIKPGEKPIHTKISERQSNRALVLTLCEETRQQYLAWYFAIVDAFKKASDLYRKGKLEAEFPPGTYRPTLKVGLVLA